MFIFIPASDLSESLETESFSEFAAPVQPRPARKINVGLLTNVQAKTWEINCQIAASIGFQSLVQGKLDKDYRVFCFDLTATTPVMREETPSGAGSPVYAIDGIGMRIGIVVQKTKLTVGVSLDDIAARITGQIISANKQMISYGLLPITDAEISKLLNGAFDISFFEQLSRACVRIGEDIQSRVGDVHVYKLEVAQIASPINYTLEHSISTSYVVHSLVKGWSYDFFMNRLKDKIQKNDESYSYIRVADSVARNCYREIMGSTPYGQKPSKVQIQQAEKIYNGYQPKEKT